MAEFIQVIMAEPMEIGEKKKIQFYFEKNFPKVFLISLLNSF